jgi:hypothetical protein
MSKSTTPQTAPPIDYQALFASLPQAYIAFAVDDPKFTIVAENLAHSTVANTTEKQVIGKPVFDVFPDVSEKYKRLGLAISLNQFEK